jgi:DNA-binding transcriptional ArsR family regulator
MIEYELVGMDLGDVRFAVSPINELVLSLRAWRDPGRYPLHLGWIRSVERLRPSLDTALLLALSNDRLWTPDFLTPRPYSPLTRLEDEFALVAATPPDVVERDIRAVHRVKPRPLYGPRVLERILSALSTYWQLCFAPHWPRMRALLEADVGFRGRQTARSGLAAMFAGLSPTVRLNGTVVEVHLRTDVSYKRRTDGGLTLVPTVWTAHASAPISPLEPASIMYQARGIGTLWEAEPQSSPSALAALLGAVRAGLLVQLAAPASSTELAARLRVTPAAANQHLRALRSGGLLVASRYGRSVLYRRSDLGDQLVSATTSET